MKTFNTFLKYLIFVGVWLVPFIPFVVANTMFFPFITGKNFMFRIVVEIIFGLWAMLAIADPVYRPAKSKLLWAVLTVLGVLVLATIFSVNPYHSFWSNFERMEGLITHIHLVAYFLVLISMFKKPESWNYYFHTWLGTSILMAFYGLHQLSDPTHLIHQGAERIDATLGNADYLAVYMLFMVFIALGYMFHRLFTVDKSQRNYWLATVYGLAGLLDGYILYKTGTRFAALGLAIGLIIVGGIMVARGRGQIRRWGAAFLIIIVVAAGGFYAVRNSSFVQQNPILYRFADTINNFSSAIKSRSLLWPMSIKGFQEHPVLGWGPENYNLVFNKYYDPKLWGQEAWFDRSHDIILDWLISAGILGLIAYLALYFVSLYYVWWGSRAATSSFDHKNNNVVLLAKASVTGLLIGYFVQNLTVFDNVISYILFFTLLAFLHTRATAMATEKKGAYKPSGLLVAVADVVIVVLTIGVVYSFNAKPIEASHELVAAISFPSTGDATNNLQLFKQMIGLGTFGTPEAREQLIQIGANISSNTATPEAVRSEFARYAYDQMALQVKESPTDARYQFFLGNYLLGFGYTDQALPYLEQALENSAGKQAIKFSLVQADVNKKDYPKAEQLAASAYTSDPTYDLARDVYWATAVYNHDTKVVTELSNLASSTPPSDVVIQAYKATGQTYPQVN